MNQFEQFCIEKQKAERGELGIQHLVDFHARQRNMFIEIVVVGAMIEEAFGKKEKDKYLNLLYNEPDEKRMKYAQKYKEKLSEYEMVSEVGEGNMLYGFKNKNTTWKNYHKNMKNKFKYIDNRFERIF